MSPLAGSGIWDGINGSYTSRRVVQRIRYSRHHPEMLKRLLDGWAFVGWAWFNAFLALPVGSAAERQSVNFFAMSDPASLRFESKLLLHPRLNFLIGGWLAH